MMDAAGAMERLAVFFSAAFAEQKFYPVFAFLFGAGYALQMQSLERAHGPGEAARIYRRHLKWLLAVGILHGTLLWFGDILLLYAISGFAFLAFRSWSARRLLWIGGGITLLWALIATAGYWGIANLPGEVAAKMGWGRPHGPPVLRNSFGYPLNQKVFTPRNLLEFQCGWGLC